MQAKLIISFETLSEPNFLTKAQLIDTSLTGNANFPLPWPAAVPTPAMLHTQVVGYEGAYNGAVGGDSTKITLRNLARATLTATLKKIAPYLEAVAGGSVPILQTTGYTLRRDMGTANVPAVLAGPSGFTVERGVVSGTLVARAPSQAGAGSYHLAMTSGDPTVEANWAEPETHLHCSHIELTGLTPGSKVSLRLRGIGKSGPGAWSDVVTIIVG